MNTGFVKYTNLIKVYKNLKDSNGNPIPVIINGNIVTKPNVEGDPDYIAPFYDNSLCPDNTPTTTKPITTTTQLVTTTSTTTNQQSCNFTINNVTIDTSNSNYNVLEIDTYSYLFGNYVDAEITQNGNVITQSNDLVYIQNNPLWINIPKSVTGTVSIKLGKGNCFDIYLYYIPEVTTTSTTNSPTTSITTLSPTTIDFFVNVKAQNCDVITTTINPNSCSLNSIVVSQQLPNQFKVTYSGSGIGNFKWYVKQNNVILQSGLITNWTGNIIYINTSPALFDGDYEMMITATDINTGLDCNSLSSNFTVTGNPYCSVVIASVWNIGLESLDVSYTTNQTSLNAEIISNGLVIYSTVINNNILTYPLGILTSGQSYTLKLSKNAQCFDTEDFQVPVITTSAPCNFVLNTPTVNQVLSGGNLAYDITFPITNGNSPYTILIYDGSFLLIAFNGTPEINNAVNFTIPEDFSGVHIQGKNITFEFQSESNVGCSKSINILIP